MSGWPTRTADEARERFARLRNAEKGSKADLKTRVALIAHDRRLTKRQVEKFRNKRGTFDYVGFAEKYDISLDWLTDGELKM